MAQNPVKVIKLVVRAPSSVISRKRGRWSQGHRWRRALCSRWLIFKSMNKNNLTLILSIVVIFLAVGLWQSISEVKVPSDSEILANNVASEPKVKTPNIQAPVQDSFIGTGTTICKPTIPTVQTTLYSEDSWTFNVGENTLSNCDLQGCSTYDMEFKDSGVYTNVQSELPRGSMLKFVNFTLDSDDKEFGNRKNDFVEVKTLGLDMYISWGTCTDVDLNSITCTPVKQMVCKLL